MKALKLSIVFVLMFSLVIITGCKNDENTTASTANTEKSNETAKKSISTLKQGLAAVPIEQVKKDIAELDVENLKEKANAYKLKIDSTKQEIEKLMQKLKDIPLTEQMNQEAKEIQGEITELSAAMEALSDRFDLYLDAIKEKSGDIKEMIQ